MARAAIPLTVQENEATRSKAPPCPSAISTARTPRSTRETAGRRCRWLPPGGDPRFRRTQRRWDVEVRFNGDVVCTAVDNGNVYLSLAQISFMP